MTMTRGRGRRAPSRFASLLFVIGCLGVLGVTFVAGVAAGRLWPRGPSVQSVVAPKEPTLGRGADRTARPSEPAPALTFYQDLTAPLTAPPPPPKPAKAGKPLVNGPRPGEQADALTGRDAATTIPGRAPTDRAVLAAPATNRFTVQVASYRVRPQAEAMRESLASAGHDARVVEADAHGPVYRVQVGDFSTRDAARAVAARLSGERLSVAPIVTPR